METFSKESGNLTRQMDMEFICMPMGLDMKDTGKMICKMATELKTGLIVQGMRAITKKAKSMVKELTLGMMDQLMKVNGSKIRSTER